ncbi:hypothetical protein FRC17_002709 [Serendipita sp. 399]|nr:hypothetical protein FRC17_002709 [Serendipita sp. 399]
MADIEKTDNHTAATPASVGAGLTVPNTTVDGPNAASTTTTTDGASTVNNLTRVNSTSDTNNELKKDDQQVRVSEKNEEGTINESSKDQNKAVPAGDESMLLTGKKLVLAHIGFLLAIFCVALDQTIVATALPKLASQFNALDQLTWVVSAYFLTQAGLMLTFGQILTIAYSKWVYFTCIIVFEIGSLICGVAPTMNVLIFGRAFQGIGASGMFVSILTILSQITRLEQRPLLFGSFGGVFALASVIGPLLGGVLTDHSTWRWCFYINLPFGAISVAAVLLFQPTNPPPPNPLYGPEVTTKQKWLSLDWVGAVLSVGTITCLLFPLQWGGISRPWNDKVVIALFATFAVLLVLFLGWEKYKGPRAMMPLSLIFQLKRTTLLGGGLMLFFMMVAFLGATYYLPLFYQSKGRTASQSGIDIIPFMISAVLFGFISGGIVNATGHYLTMMIIGPLIGAVGAGLLFTVNENTANAKIIGYQILFGSGVGMAFQLPVMATQAEYADEPELIPQASSLLTFLQLLGGVVGIAIAGTVFNNQLSKELGFYVARGDILPMIADAVKRSVTAIFMIQDPDKKQLVIHSYVRALDYTFLLSVPACVLTSVAVSLVKNWNLKKRGGMMPGGGGAV